MPSPDNVERIKQEELTRLEAKAEFEKAAQEKAHKEARDREMPLSRWFIALGVVAVAGLALLTILQIHDGITRLLPARVGTWRVLSWNRVIAILLLGYAITNALLYFAMRVVVDGVLGRRKLPLQPAEWPPVLVGSVEALLYPVALLSGHAEFIGLWLAVKVAGQWELWEKDQEGRIRFNRFLVGNGLSILFNAGVYAAIIMWAFQPVSSWRSL